MLDRIDLQVEVPHLPSDKLIQGKVEGDSSAVVYQRVLSAQQRQLHRSGKLNALMSNQEVVKYCALNVEQKSLLNRAIQQLGLTARGFHRVLKVALTIADLEKANLDGNKMDTTALNIDHLTEALGYRITG